MYFIESGAMNYFEGGTTKRSDRTRQTARQISRMQAQLGRKLAKKNWVCELALWVAGFQNQGELVAISDCNLIYIDSLAFSNAIISFPATRFDVLLYARWA